MSHLPTILLVDDGADDRELLSLLLRGAFGEVTIEEATDATSLARAISAGRFGAVLTEHELSWIRSGDLLRLIRDVRPNCPVLVVTGRPIERVAAEIVHLAPDGLIPKTAAGLVGLPRALRAALLSTRRQQTSSTDAASRHLLDALPAGVLVISGQGTIEDANPALARVLGFASEVDCVQRPFESMFAEPSVASELLSRLADGKSVLHERVRVRRADEAVVDGELSLWRAAGGPGAIQGMLTAASPSSAEESGRSALDEMVYAVSHDLRKPVTQVVQLLKLHAEESARGAGKDGAQLLDQARASASRLEAMVDAVMRLGRLESTEAELAQVDLDALAARVIERLEEERSALGGRIEHASLGLVCGDEAQLELLLHNLLDNALKFHGDERPRIRIDCETEARFWHVRVRDNGVGVPARDAKRIFVPFQRLHTSREAPGTGIGLALCRRVVARHGGRIWVDSDPGEGSVFHFTLARPSPASADASRGPSR